MIPSRLGKTTAQRDVLTLHRQEESLRAEESTMPPPVYLDHQNASPLRPEAFEAMRPFLTDQWGSASSLHRRGQKARQALQRAREQIATFLNAKNSEDILFTANGTEAANLAIRGAAETLERRESPGDFVTSAVEHPAILKNADWLEQRGWEKTILPVNADGCIDEEALAKKLVNLRADKPFFAAFQLANLDIGTIQPIRRLYDRMFGGDGYHYYDATAATGWLPIDVQALDVDLLSLSPQRIGGPVGVGILYVEPRTKLTPQILGGEQEHGLRGGTENLPAIVGAGVALELAAQEHEQRIAHVSKLQKVLWEGLRERVPDLHLNGPEPGPDRLPNQLNLSPVGLEGEAILLALDLAGVQVHAGAGCVSKQLKVPPVLAAIGLESKLAQASVTLSLGAENTEEEIQRVLEAFPKVVARLRAMSPNRGGAPVRVAKPKD